MIYTQLSPEYKYDTIADAIYAREVEYFHYDFDRANFSRLVETLPDCPFRDETQKRMNDTIMQMSSVVAIIDALNSQIDNEELYQEAVARAIARRKVEVNK